MHETTKTLLKALFFFVFAIGCLWLALSGKAHGSYPYLGAVLGLMAAFGFLRQGLRK